MRFERPYILNLGFSLLLVLFPWGRAAGVPDPPLEHGPFEVGYRVSHLSDPARSFGPRADLAGKPQPGALWRPVAIHLWYPARGGGGEPRMSTRDYVLAAQIIHRPETSTAIHESEALAAYKASALRRGADEAKLDAHLDQKTRARKDASPAPGRHPVILYAPSINSDPYENAVLCEFLASHGYVIASAPSIGLQELEVTRDDDGARAQVGDLRFVLSQVWSEPFVDSARLGVLGYSWGGMTALLFALPHWEVDAVACLDGAMRMAEYRPVAESFASWSAQNLRAALLDIAPADERREPSLGEAARYADSYEWLVPGVVHRDFAWDFIVRYRYATGDTASDRVMATYGAIGRRLKEFFDSYLKDDRAGLESLRHAEGTIEGSTWSFRTALAEPPTAAQFDQVIEEKGVDAAVELFHALRRADPDLVLFDEKRLLRYPVLWGPERAADLIALLNMNLEAYPASAESHFWLAQVHLSRDDADTALQELKTALTLNPGHERARRLLDRLDPASTGPGP